MEILNTSHWVPRRLEAVVLARLKAMPAVAIMGPRQVGKTRLARKIAKNYSGAIFLDLETIKDRQLLGEPELFFSAHRHRLIVLDEVQMMPEIFQALRPEIDNHRTSGRFLILGSATGKLLKQSSESLAGRVSYVELSPLLANEINLLEQSQEQDSGQELFEIQQLWLKGGYPGSYIDTSDEISYSWRADLIKTLLQRDFPSLGIQTASESLSRFWRMLANLHSQLLNSSMLARSLGYGSPKTADHYLDFFVDSMMVRRLQPYLTNFPKRLVKSSRIYLRDSGILHALLNIESIQDLQGHPIVGASWEGFVIEQIACNLPIGAQISFYRTQVGSELDLVIEKGRHRLGIEIKFSMSPKVSRGFWQALKDIEATAAYIIAPVSMQYSYKENVQVMSVQDFIRDVVPLL